MQIVLGILLILVTPYLVLSLADRWIDRVSIAPPVRARVGLSLLFTYISMEHFIQTEAMSLMLPPFVPYRIELIYATGILELLGAIGVWVPGLTRLTGVLLIIMLAGLLPANIYSAFNHLKFGGHGAGPIYLLIRVPAQFFLVWWTYFATNQHWFRRQPERA